MLRAVAMGARTRGQAGHVDAVGVHTAGGGAAACEDDPCQLDATVGGERAVALGRGGYGGSEQQWQG